MPLKYPEVLKLDLFRRGINIAFIYQTSQKYFLQPINSQIEISHPWKEEIVLSLISGDLYEADGVSKLRRG